MNEVVTYKNELNMMVLPKNFNDIDCRIFWAILSKMRDKGSEEVTFRFDYLKQITLEKSHFTNKQYREVVQNVYHKIIGLRFVYLNNEVEGEVNLFQGYERKLTDNSFTISITPKFQRIFNNLALEGQFTSWKLEEFCNLSGIYAKNLFRLLKQWKYVGHASYLIEDLRQYMGVPDTYSMKQVTARVINPAVNELINNAPGFTSLRYEYSKSGHKIVRVKFTWFPEKRTKEIEAKKHPWDMSDEDKSMDAKLRSTLNKVLSEDDNEKEEQMGIKEIEGYDVDDTDTTGSYVFNLADIFGNDSGEGEKK